MLSVLLFILFQLTQQLEPPAGTMKVKEYYIDKTEVLNMHWMEFLRAKEKELSPEELQSLLPHQPSKAYAQPENGFKPLVLVSYEQAVAYCQWRSEVVSRQTKKKVTYRLPTPQEWKAIAQDQLAAQQTERELKELQRKMVKADGAYLLVEEFKPKDKIYHLLDNVSEMTSQKGVALGLSNYDMYKLAGGGTSPLEACLNAVPYKAPHPYLGFRCVAVVEK